MTGHLWSGVIRALGSTQVGTAHWNKREERGDFICVTEVRSALRDHIPEYLIEAWCLGTFMFSACAFGVLLFHPGSPTAPWNESIRTALMGLAMGATAIAIIKSKLGKRSGAHFNPAVTLTFWHLGKIGARDAAMYIVAQTAGGIGGVLIAWAVFGETLSHTAVNFVVTSPGRYGGPAAFVAESAISFIQMSAVLWISNSRRLAHFTPFAAGALVAAFITFESHISGMSMNPARTLASSVVAREWDGWWIYLFAPTLSMLAAAEVFNRIRGPRSVLCAKLDHSSPTARCIFRCGYHETNDIAVEMKSPAVQMANVADGN